MLRAARRAMPVILICHCQAVAMMPLITPLMSSLLIIADYIFAITPFILDRRRRQPRHAAAILPPLYCHDYADAIFAMPIEPCRRLILDCLDYAAHDADDASYDATLMIFYAAAAILPDAD